jgi:hypothetical protein
VKAIAAPETRVSFAVMVVRFDKLFHIVTLREICPNAAFRIGGALCAFAHTHVQAVADVDVRTGEISAVNSEGIFDFTELFEPGFMFCQQFIQYTGQMLAEGFFKGFQTRIGVVKSATPQLALEFFRSAQTHFALCSALVWTGWRNTP